MDNILDNFIETLEKLKKDKSPEKYFLDKIKYIEEDIFKLQKKLNQLLFMIHAKQIDKNNIIKDVLDDIKNFD